jgi:hypothetical protein
MFEEYKNRYKPEVPLTVFFATGVSHKKTKEHEHDELPNVLYSKLNKLLSSASKRGTRILMLIPEDEMVRRRESGEINILWRSLRLSS